MKNPLFLLILTLGFLATGHAKQLPKATTTVQIHPSVIALTPDKANAGALLNRNYMENEFENIVAPETLKIAAQTLELDLKANPKALKTLKSKIITKPVRGTDFIQISATGTSKEEAVKVVEAVTSAYIKRRNDAAAAKSKQALALLDQELINQSEQVAKHRKELTKLIQEHGIPYFDNGNPSPGPTEKEMLKNAKEKLAQFKAIRDQLETKVTKLVELTDDKLFIYAANPDLPENKIADHYIKYQEARTEKLALYDQGLSHKHPKIKATGERAQKSLESAQKEIASLEEILSTKLELVNRQIERMDTMLNRKVNDTIELPLRQNQYNQAKETYEHSRGILREMKLHQQETRALLKMPRDPVTIHEPAK